MRLTRETLIKVARDAANQRARVSRRIICIYLTGSVLEDAPLLGGTTDIDLVIIHDSEPLQPREVVRLTDEVHLDIGHYDQSVFHQPRHLRTDPWLGPFIYRKPMVLYETHHWFDFIQAATGAQFFQPDYVVQRAAALAQKARQIWMDLEFNPGEPHAVRLNKYLKVIENAGNALVCLTDEGNPLAERRFMLQLPQRLQALNQPGLIADLINLMVPDLSLLEGNWSVWLPSWKEAYQAASQQENIPPRLHACRQIYYERAISTLWEESESAGLWLLLRTWSQAAENLPADSPAFSGWQSACQFLNLDETHFAKRLQSMDQYLDHVEEWLDTWASSNGVTGLTDA